MPIIKSAIKRAKQEQVRRKRNNVTRNRLRNSLKEFNTLAAKKDKKAGEKLSAAYSAIDTAAKKNVLHKNKAARMKAQVAATAKEAGVAMPKNGAKKAAAPKKATAKKAAPKKPVAKKTAVKKAAPKKAPAKKKAA